MGMTHTPWRTLSLVLGLLMLHLVTSGCASDPGGPLKGVLKPPYEPLETVRGSELLLLSERESQVVVTDAGQEHNAVNRTEAVNPNVWRMSVGGWWVVDVTQDRAGGVLILSEVERAEERRVEYDPPLPLVPAELKRDEPLEVSSRVSVYNHANNVLESTGTVTATYTLLGGKTLDARGRPRSSGATESPQTGAFEGAEAGGEATELAIIEVERRYKLPLVIVDMKIQTAYLPGEGPVAARNRRTVRLLGVIPVMHEQLVTRR